MPKVIIASGGSCHQFTGGKTEFEVEATTFRQLVRELERKYPGLGNQVEEGVELIVFAPVGAPQSEAGRA